MTCNVCRGPIESPKDFDRGWCEWHETLEESGVVTNHGTFSVFDPPPGWLARLLSREFVP